MTMQGANADDLDRLAGEFEARAVQLEKLRDRLNGRLYSVRWTGRSAQTFRTNWQHRHRPALTGAANRLRSTAETLRRQAREQRHASSGEGGQIGSAAARLPVVSPAATTIPLAEDVLRQLETAYDKAYDVVTAAQHVNEIAIGLTKGMVKSGGLSALTLITTGYSAIRWAESGATQGWWDGETLDKGVDLFGGVGVMTGLALVSNPVGWGAGAAGLAWMGSTKVGEAAAHVLDDRFDTTGKGLSFAYGDTSDMTPAAAARMTERTSKPWLYATDVAKSAWNKFF